MKNYTYHFEIKDLLTQFAAAFDDVVIKRYNKNRVAEQSVNVRYVLAPKERVMYDIVNKAQNLTLPVIAMNVTSIARDNNRVFNKLDHLYNYKDEKRSTYISMPVPINIEVSMSILSRYMQDMDQILSNFIPYSNPYVIISHKEPNATQNTVEMRTEVNWSGNISMTSPTDITYSDKFRIVADTSFTIKGWLFKDTNSITPPIYNIKYNAINVGPNFSIDALDDVSDYETITNSLSDNIAFGTLSGSPTLTDLFFFTGSNYIRMFPPYTITGSITSIGDSYGAGGTYGRGSMLGIDYGPGGQYTDNIENIDRESGEEQQYDYNTFKFNRYGGYSSGRGSLIGGGNYLVTGNNLSTLQYTILSSSDITSFYPTIINDILTNTSLQSFISGISTNTYYVSCLNSFLQNNTNISLISNLTSVPSFYNFINIFNIATNNISIFAGLSSIYGFSSILSSYNIPTFITPTLSCVNAPKSDIICGYILPNQRYTALSDNIVAINLPLIYNNIFDIIFITNAGWTSTQYIENKSQCCNC